MEHTAPSAATELTAETPDGSAGAPRWGGVIAMSVCVFALIASEFMPVSLLTPMAAAFDVSEGAAGQGIAISGAFAVATSLTVARLAGRMDRRTLLLVLTGIMAVSAAVVGLAPNYLLYMVGRALIGIVIGGFWSMSTATAVRLVPSQSVPRALAIINGGNALASVLAAPLGSYLGALVGWRGAFLVLVPIAAGAFIWQWRSLPSLPAPRRNPGAGSIFSALRRRHVVVGLAACGAFYMGHLSSWTYIRPLLETVTGVDALTLGILLLVVGSAGLVGTLLVSRPLARSLHGTLAVIPLLVAGIVLAFIPLGGSLPVVVVLLALWGLLSTAAPVGWFAWVAKATPNDVESGGGLLVAVIQLSIALGSVAGGVLYDTNGPVGMLVASAALLVISVVAVLLSARRPARLHS